MNQYGIPEINPEYGIKDDSDRNYVKVPLDPKQQSCVDLENALTQIDEYMVENQKDMFEVLSKLETLPTRKKGKKTVKIHGSKLYEYIPLVKESSDKTKFDASDVVDDDDDEDNTHSEEEEEVEVEETEEADETPKRNKFRSTKLKLDTDWETGRISTVVYVQDDSKGTNRRRVTVNTATDLAKYLTWNCTVRFVVMVNKVWAGKNPMAKNKFRSYGLTQKIKQVLIIPSEYQAKPDYQECAFDSDTDEDESDDNIENDSEEEEEDEASDEVSEEEEEEEDDDD
jgi:hypothetical protein